MGMAASQARYLQLAARKSNVEFEGQQINQQRTILSTESNQFYSELTALSVPTAPSSSNYTKTIYTFSDGENDYTLDNVKSKTGDPDYNSTVVYHYETKEEEGIQKTRSDLGVNYVAVAGGTGTYWLTDGGSGTSVVNKSKLTQCNTTSTTSSTWKSEIDKIYQQGACDANFSTDYNKATGGASGDLSNFYYGVDTTGVTHYYSGTDLLNASALGGKATTTTSSYVTNIEKQINQTTDAYIRTENNGRYSSIIPKGYNTSFDVNCTTTIDETAYNDAYNEYQYKDKVYTQQVQSINAQISIVQNEDQQLELRLDELDTEQQALSTEMDSVKKVINKNIESTFKAFGD